MGPFGHSRGSLYWVRKFPIPYEKQLRAFGVKDFLTDNLIAGLEVNIVFSDHGVPSSKMNFFLQVF